MVLSDISTYCQVLGGLIKKPELRYKYDDIIEEDFDIKLIRMFFLVIKFLSKNNQVELTEFDIDSYIISNDTLKNEYERNDGQAFLQQVISVANPDNFDYYYNRLKKLSLLRDLRHNGFNIDYYYQENFSSRKDELECIDRFDNATIDDILDKVEGDFNLIKQNFVKGRLSGQSAADGIDELVSRLARTPDFGVEMYGDVFSSVVRGARKGCLYLRSALTNVGKSLPDSMIIPTTAGYKAVGDVSVGDYLFDLYGKPTKVLGVFPQAAPQKIYKLFFSDGRVCRSTADHLWSYWNKTDKTVDCLHTAALKEIIDDKTGIKNGDYYFPLSSEIDLNGRYESDAAKVGFLLGQYHKYNKRDSSLINGSNLPKQSDFIRVVNGAAKSRKEFLLSVFEKSSGLYKYITNSYTFTMNLYAVCNSLGIRAIVNCDLNKSKYELVFLATNLLKTKSRMFDFCQLSRIIDLNQEEDATCFLVDNPLHLFVAENGVVTHNTRLAVFDLCKIVYPIKYERVRNDDGTYTSGFFQEDRPPQKGLFVSTENGADEIQTVILAYLSGVNEDNILYNIYEPGERERVEYAKKIMRRYKDCFFIEQITDPNLTNVQSIIKKYVTFNKVKYVFYDYLFTSPSLISQFSKNEIREETALELLTNQLKELANQYKIFVMTATQLNGEALRWDTPKNQGCLKSSKAIATKPDLCMIISKVAKEELNLIEQTKILEHFPAMAAPTHVIDIYKYRRGRYKDVRIWTKIDLGTGERQDLFVTDLNYNIIPIKRFAANCTKELCDINTFVSQYEHEQETQQKKADDRMRAIEDRVNQMREDEARRNASRANMINEDWGAIL